MKYLSQETSLTCTHFQGYINDKFCQWRRHLLAEGVATFFLSLLAISVLFAKQVMGYENKLPTDDVIAGV